MTTAELARLDAIAANLRTASDELARLLTDGVAEGETRRSLVRLMNHASDTAKRAKHAARAAHRAADADPEPQTETDDPLAATARRIKARYIARQVAAKRAARTRR